MIMIDGLDARAAGGRAAVQRRRREGGAGRAYAGRRPAARDLARRERYAARQARDRATLMIERLRRRERDLSGRLDRMPPLAPAAGVAPAPATAPGALRTGHSAAPHASHRTRRHRPPSRRGGCAGGGRLTRGRRARPAGRQPGCQGVMAMDSTDPPILIARPGRLVATRIGVTVPEPELAT